jgi:nucleoid-associated protein YgaU
VSLLSELDGILNPGGDYMAVYGAAAACRALAAELRGSHASLNEVAAGLAKSWKSLGSKTDQSGAAAFQRAWGTFSSHIEDYARHLDTAVQQIEAIANAIQTANAQAAKLKETIEITLAAGAVLTFISFGISDAAAEASLMADVAVATGTMSAFDAALADAAAIVDGLLAALGRVAAQFALGVFFDGASVVLGKVLHGENPFSLANWDANDFINIITAGLASAGLGVAIAQIGPLAAWMESSPVLGTAVWSFTGSLAWSVPWEFWVLNQPFDLHTWELIGESAGISLITSGALDKLGSMGRPLGSILSTEGGNASPAANAGRIAQALNTAGVTRGDAVRNGLVLPVSMVKYFLFGGPQPKGLVAPTAPGAIGRAPVPDVPAPEAAGLPPGSATHVVQPGDTVWAIAGGDPAQVQRIAEVNHLEDASQIWPGQKLIVPPAR